MATDLRSGPYRFFFYAGDRDEPHVESGDGTAKFWLEPVRLAWSHGFSAREINQIGRLISQSSLQLIESWNAFFNG